MPPQEPSSNALESRVIKCSWIPPPYEHQNGDILGYRVNLTEVATGKTVTYSSVSTSLVIESLHPDYAYEWRVAAVTIGVGPFTITNTIRTNEDGKNQTH